MLNFSSGPPGSTCTCWFRSEFALEQNGFHGKTRDSLGTFVSGDYIQYIRQSEMKEIIL